MDNTVIHIHQGIVNTVCTDILGRIDPDHSPYSITSIEVNVLTRLIVMNSTHQDTGMQYQVLLYTYCTGNSIVNNNDTNTEPIDPNTYRY